MSPVNSAEIRSRQAAPGPLGVMAQDRMRVSSAAACAVTAEVP